jgi:putative Ca2+/H+ antiporter (TMEM165/GDT1 family)
MLNAAAAATAAATVAAAVAADLQSPWGVAVGATAAYAAATGLAVLGGAWAAKYVSQQALDAVCGLLFLVFATVTMLSFLQQLDLLS